MCKQFGKSLFYLLALLSAIIWMPLNAQAAQPQQPAKTVQAVLGPSFKKVYKYLYENRASRGAYDLKVLNVKKGYMLKWSVTGSGKDYASFASAETIAKGKQSANKLIVNSHGQMAFADAKKINVVVKVYAAKNRLVKELTFSAKLRSEASSVRINTSEIENLNQITAGRSYALKAEMLPLNTTSKAYWQIMDAGGVDHSKEITANGIWTPVKEGTYTITVSMKNAPSDKVLCSGAVQAVACSFMESVTQTAINGIQVTFNTEAATRYKETDFSIVSDGVSIPVKKMKILEGAKTVYLTTAADFVDQRRYTVSCAGTQREFKASVGRPAALSITTASAQVEKFTTIKYVLLDANGIDVTSVEAQNGVVVYTPDVKNGYLDEQTKRLYMTVVGNTATITLEYTSKDGTIRLMDTKTIFCVPRKAQEPADTRFTLTDSEQEPSYREDDMRSIAAGSKMYAHFRGLDEDDSVIHYDSITYESTNPDRLIISPTGKITPIKEGTVSIVVTAKQDSDIVTFTYPVTVLEASYLAGLQMQQTTIEISNAYLPEYQKEIAVGAVDQYGKNYKLENEAASISGSAGQKVLASYNPTEHSVIVRAQGASAGVYDFLLAVTVNGKTVSQRFSVQVSVPDANGAVTYAAQADRDSIDLSVDANTTGNRTLKVRLCEYRGGVFYGYKNFVSASIRKNNLYYGTDLVTSSVNALTLPGAKELTLTPLTITPSSSGTVSGSCIKAEPGIYTVSLTYMETAGSTKTENASITITDGQNPPEYSIRSYTTENTVTNALDMARECIYIPDSTILDCTAAGTGLTGSAILVESGEQLHINTITVKSAVTIADGTKVYVNHVIKIDKTFTNKARINR